MEAASALADRTFALGLGLTNECNLSCSFCYRDPTRTDRLDVAQVQALIARLPFRSINLGTGENGMHPQFGAILDVLRAEPLKLTVTSNGHTVEVLDDEQVRAFTDIEFSIDYPNKEEQDAQRGDGNWDLVMAQAERCRRLGIGVSFISVMMRTNFDRLHEVAAVAKRFEAPLRINVYQAVRTDTFALSYEEYWTGFARLFAETDVIAIGDEPLVRAVAGLPPSSGGCGRSTIRVTPAGRIQPCVYWGRKGSAHERPSRNRRGHHRERAFRRCPRPSRTLQRLRPSGDVSRRLRWSAVDFCSASTRSIPIALSCAAIRSRCYR